MFGFCSRGKHIPWHLCVWHFVRNHPRECYFWRHFLAHVIVWPRLALCAQFKHKSSTTAADIYKNQHWLNFSSAYSFHTRPYIHMPIRRYLNIHTFNLEAHYPPVWIRRNRSSPSHINVIYAILTTIISFRKKSFSPKYLPYLIRLSSLGKKTDNARLSRNEISPLFFSYDSRRPHVRTPKLGISK